MIKGHILYKSSLQILRCSLKCSSLPRKALSTMYKGAFLIGWIQGLKPNSFIHKYIFMKSFVIILIFRGFFLIPILLGAILNLPVQIARSSAKNKRIHATYQLVNQIDSRLLWSTAYTCEADWSLSEDEVVAQVNFRSACKFPYRIGR